MICLCAQPMGNESTTETTTEHEIKALTTLEVSYLKLKAQDQPLGFLYIGIILLFIFFNVV